MTDPTGAKLHLVCYDKDLFRKNFLGQIQIDLGETLSPNRNRESLIWENPDNLPCWYPLDSKTGGGLVEGELLVKFGWEGLVSAQELQGFKSLTPRVENRTKSDSY